MTKSKIEMGIDTTITDSIEMEQLVWYGHKKRLVQEILPQKNLQVEV